MTDNVWLDFAIIAGVFSAAVFLVILLDFMDRTK